MVKLFILYVLAAMVVAFIGRNRGYQFWGFFFASLLFTPLIGLLMLIATFCKPKQKQ